MPTRSCRAILSVLLAASLLFSLAAPLLSAEPSAPRPTVLLDEARERLRTGQQAEALELIDQAAQTIWNRMGLSIPTALLTHEKAQGYGIYNPRDDNVYAKGQPVQAYLEPVGYRVREVQPGLFVFGVSVDVAILRPAGEVVWGKENFFQKTVESRRFNRDFYLTITLNISGAPPGDYVLKFTVRDKQGVAPAEARLPIRIR